MSHNTFGHLFRVTTFGESHGEAIGCVVDGCPPGLSISNLDIQPFLDKRKPGQSRYTTQRQESDVVSIISGVFEGKTTGTPIALLIKNQDQRSKDYSEIINKFRPGHADFTYIKKYGLRDHRGGGRASARETAMRVAAGAIARKILGSKITIRAALIKMGIHAIDNGKWNWDEVHNNPFFTPDAEAARSFETYLNKVRKAGSSVGAMIEIRATGVPAGWGAPIYGKLDADITAAIMSINAVKGVEIGAGMQVAELTGEENADEMRMEGDKPQFLSNNNGGILGGISTGQDLIIRFSVKPTSSILTPRKTIDLSGGETEIATKGRHDPCVGIRAVPVGEAMTACVLADHLLRHRAQCG
ncbi:MAG: chorismate synthase [Rhodospirillaceae bacterium TMED8]|nr:chorismate synthase [Magnetovibrio sp.]OUT50909.1 MAG: chorismate synthase [Rhodospirillaceae bacterium TMED8]|tara:strand:- start:811 stop:1881 length:1071 start_codon:yes stop_codon:yes gene_type:complete